MAFSFSAAMGGFAKKGSERMIEKRDKNAKTMERLLLSADEDYRSANATHSATTAKLTAVFKQGKDLGLSKAEAAQLARSGDPARQIKLIRDGLDTGRSLKTILGGRTGLGGTTKPGDETYLPTRTGTAPVRTPDEDGVLKSVFGKADPKDVMNQQRSGMTPERYAMAYGTTVDAPGGGMDVRDPNVALDLRIKKAQLANAVADKAKIEGGDKSKFLKQLGNQIKAGYGATMMYDQATGLSSYKFPADKANLEKYVEQMTNDIYLNTYIKGKEDPESWPTLTRDVLRGVADQDSAFVDGLYHDWKPYTVKPDATEKPGGGATSVKPGGAAKKPALPPVVVPDAATTPDAQIVNLKKQIANAIARKKPKLTARLTADLNALGGKYP